MFKALDAPNAHRVQLPRQSDVSANVPAARIVPHSISLFRQRLPMDLGFASAFLTPQHILATGQSPAAFWKNIEMRCAGGTTEQLLGSYDWSILHFKRTGPGGHALRRKPAIEKVIAIK